jgi:GntR family transcriptional regulator, sialic acid-inducible nan operon repressor
MTPSFDVQPVRRRKLYEEIVEKIQELMLDGRLAPGDQLPSERDLMLRFQVGRTAVREALFALNRMGLISLQNGERALVTRPTPRMLLNELSGAVRHMLAAPDGVRHFQNARALFETALARDAATHASAEDIGRLEAALKRNREALGNADAFIASDVAFHYVLAEMPRNPIFTALHAAIAEWLQEQRATSVHEHGSPDAACRAHERIFQAVAARDPDAAERAMREHLDEVGRFYWQARGSTQ